MAVTVQMVNIVNVISKNMYEATIQHHNDI